MPQVIKIIQMGRKVWLSIFPRRSSPGYKDRDRDLKKSVCKSVVFLEGRMGKGFLST